MKKTTKKKEKTHYLITLWDSFPRFQFKCATSEAASSLAKTLAASFVRSSAWHFIEIDVYRVGADGVSVFVFGWCSNHKGKIVKVRP